MKVLPDTSIWVEVLNQRRSPLREHFDALLESVVTCGPVLAEILIGALPHQLKDLTSTLTRLEWLDLDQEAWQQVGEVGYQLMRAGMRLPVTDLSIAVAAANAGAELWTADPDFDRLVELLPGFRLHEAP